MRRMLREVPNCESTHAEHGRDVHSRGWRTHVAVICDYIMVSPGPSRGQRQHGGREISFVSRRAAPRRVARPSPPVGAERRRRGRFLAQRSTTSPATLAPTPPRISPRPVASRAPTSVFRHRRSPRYSTIGPSTHARTCGAPSSSPPRISRPISACRLGISR